MNSNEHEKQKARASKEHVNVKNVSFLVQAE
jgi:hypothetical protein